MIHWALPKPGPGSKFFCFFLPKKSTETRPEFRPGHFLRNLSATKKIFLQVETYFRCNNTHECFYYYINIISSKIYNAKLIYI